MTDLTKLEQKHKELGEEIARLKSKPKTDVALMTECEGDDAHHYYIDNCGYADEASSRIEDTVNNGAAFKTEEGAERQVLINKYFLTLARCEGARDYVKDGNYFICLIRDNLEVNSWCILLSSPQAIYFDTLLEATKAMEQVNEDFTIKEIKTIFNVLGPLTNPARATRQVIGVYDAKLTDIVAKVLKKLNTEHAFVVYGYDGMDEITTTDKTKVCELKDGKIKSYFITHDSFGIPKAEMNDFIVNSPEESVIAINAVLDGAVGPKRDIVLLNASAAIVAGGGADNLKDGVQIAAESIDSGKARASLEKLIELTQNIGDTSIN